MALTLGDNFSYQGAKPLDARLKYETVAAMKAVADATMYDGCLAYCAGTDKTYQWKSTNTVDETLGKWREFTSGGGGGGGASYTAGDGIDITNDVISTKQSETGDIDKIIDRYPTAGELVSIVNAFNKGDLYSTDEKMIGQWIDGKPLYQKTIQATIPTVQGAPTDVSIGASIDTVVDAKTMFTTGNGGFIQTPVINGALSGSVRLSVYNNSYPTASLQNKFRLEQLSGTIVMGGSSCYVTIQYTKTTDQAVSIGEANDYSTTEKIIGSWIDGKPLYQKTVETVSPNTTKATQKIVQLDAECRIQNFFGVIGESISGSVAKKPLNYGNPELSFYMHTYSPYGNDLWMYVTRSAEVNAPVWVTVQYTKTT